MEELEGTNPWWMVSGILEGQPILGTIDEFGVRFTVDIEVVGPAGRAMVRTGWICRRGSPVPQLATLFVRSSS